MDLYPTFAALAGAKVSPTQVLDGKNLWPLLSGETDATPRDEFFYFVRHGVLAGVRQGRWKLLMQGDKPELYDLDADLGESRNLANEHPKIVEQLGVRLKQFEANVKSTKRQPGVKADSTQQNKSPD